MRSRTSEAGGEQVREIANLFAYLGDCGRFDESTKSYGAEREDELR